MREWTSSCVYIYPRIFGSVAENLCTGDTLGEPINFGSSSCCCRHSSLLYQVLLFGVLLLLHRIMLIRDSRLPSIYLSSSLLCASDTYIYDEREGSILFFRFRDLLDFQRQWTSSRFVACSVYV